MQDQTPNGPQPPQPQPPPPSFPAEPGRRWLPVAIVTAAIVVAAALIGGALIMSRRTPTQSSGPPSVQPSRTAPVEPSSTGQAGPSSINPECNASTVPLVNLKSRADGEPMLALPQPPGWVFNTEMDSSLIRAVMGNPELLANNFTPDTVVTLENLTGRVGTPQQALDGERTGITANIGPLDTDVPGVTCGYPSVTITYAMPANGHQATALIVAGQDGSNQIWAATVTVQATDPANPAYVDAKDAILHGFQFSLPR